MVKALEMCLSPKFLPENGKTVACRVCELCKDAKVNDWVGRCKAELISAKWTLFATLTYGGDDVYGGSENNLRAKKLHYEDIRLWLLLMRKWTNRGPAGEMITGVNKNKLRYFAIGEYGSAKGRAHWHVLLFGEGAMPPNIKLSEPGLMPVRYWHGHQKGGLLWPHGFSQWRVADEGGIRYAVKYINKADVMLQEEKRCGYSMQPPLGDAYFKLEAQRYVAQGLSPRDHFYRFPDDFKRDGTPRLYWLGGSAWYNFLTYFADAWVAKYGSENWPDNEVMNEFVEERYMRSQLGLEDWRDEPEWRELKRQEGMAKWLAKKAAVGGGTVRQSPPSVVRPFPPVDAYDPN